MYQALYRKYRPQNFNEVVGQDVVKKIILNEINKNKISHAYLFCGPRGTGKTSVAKLIAKIINCDSQENGVACGKCDSCMQFQKKNYVDIIEIDAASNNGVDEIRELRNKANLLPAISKYKIYIIDEVHMLSIGAFNALLKTLEEPPKHVIFILATTELNKIPSTIISRCQRFDFNKISEQKIVERLKYIVDRENINITDDALNEIAHMTDGGLRDAIGLLDKVLAYTNEVITDEIVHVVNYSLTRKKIAKLFEMLIDNRVDEYINYINELNDTGIDLPKVVDELMQYLRDLILKKIDNNYDSKIILKYINELNDLSYKIKTTNYPKILLETFIIIVNNEINNKKVIKNNIDVVSVNVKNNDKNSVDVVSSSKDTIIEEEKIEELPKAETNIVVENIPMKMSEESQVVDTKKILTINDLVETRINNTFALCNKNYLNDLKERWKSISEYSVNPMYGMAAGILLDGELVVASDRNIVAVYPYTSMTERANNDLPTIEKLLKLVFNIDYKFVALDQNQWNKFKKDYIKNIKSNNQYKYINEDVDYNTLFKLEDDSIVEQALDFFGEELVQVI